MLEISKIKDIKVLYIEENEKIRQHISYIFKQIYGIVYDCSNGLDALEIIKLNNIDVLISDIELTNIDGIKLLKEIKKIKPIIKIILITNCNNNKILLETFNIGIDFYETKPINVKKIFENIQILNSKIKNHENFLNKKKENEKLLEIINDISITLELDENFNIIKSNSKYKSFANLNKSFFENINLESKESILKDLDLNFIFNGKLVFENEDGRLYSNASIIQTIENNSIKYIVIAIENNEYLKLREDNQKKLSFLSKQKIESYSKEKEIKDLKDEIIKIKSEILDGTNSFVVEENKFLNLKIKKLNNQINFFEDKIKELNHKLEISNIETIERLRETNKITLSKYHESVKNLKDEIKELNIELNTIKSLKFEISGLKKREKDLLELITHYELQISHLKKKQINN